MKSNPVFLVQEQAVCVAKAFREVTMRAGYELARASIMQDHVHLLVAAHPDGKDEIFRRFKNVSAVRLTQLFGRPPPKAGSDGNGKWWTKGGSKREKWD